MTKSEKCTKTFDDQPTQATHGVPTTLDTLPSTIPSRKSVDMRRYLAGFIAGCVSRTCTAPIDRLKVLRQAAAPEIVGLSAYRSMFSSFVKITLCIYALSVDV